ncbi:MAG: metallophosphoesterase [Clostridia bacterium]|nr:metallophosphoesterase [Clostridia bacterium]
MQIILTLLSILMLLLPLTVSAESSPEQPLRLAFLTDLHFIAPELTDYGPGFMQVIENADGKATRYCDEITDAFIEQLLLRHTDALILQGDLTFNGAIQSHQVLTGKLRRVLDAGIPVYVIPGNHDVYNRNAARFEETQFERIPSATSDQFRSIWNDFGYSGAVSCAPDSLSYTIDLSPSIRLLMVDVNTENHIGELTMETARWIETQLKDAEKSHHKVISVSHQTILSHNILFIDGFRMTGGEQLAALYESCGVLCNVSGHMHIQHITVSDGGLPEIVASSVSVSPCQFGMLTVTGNQLEYYTEIIDVSAWAGRHDVQDPNLQDFKRYASAFFASGTLRQAAAMLQALPKEEQTHLLTYMANLNAAYFEGNLTEFSESDPEFQTLLHMDGFWSLYLSSIRPDLSKDYTRFRHTRQ